MPIKVACPSCGHQYQVADALAGKKVKCKECGGIIAIPAPGSEEDFDFGAIDVEPEQPAPGRSSAGARVEQPRYEQPVDEEEPAGGEAIPEYNFKGAPVVQSVVPAILGAGCLGWMAVQAFRADDPNHGWVGPFRAAVYLLGYAVVVFPITLIGVRAAGQKAYVAMPENYRWKSFGIFSVPAALAAIFTLISPSVVMLVVGIAVGLIISIGAFIFLFGIRPQRMGVAIGALIGYVIGGAVLGVALLFGIAFLVQAILGLTKTAHEYSFNPVGPQFMWTATPPEEKKKHPIVEVPTTEPAMTQPSESTGTTQPTTNPSLAETHPTTNPTTQTAISTTKPATTQAVHPTVVEHTLSPLLTGEPSVLPVDSFLEASFCGQGMGSTVLLQTAHADFGDSFELWNATNGTWSKGIAFSTQPKTAEHSPIVLNARGTALARMIEFPRVCVEFRSLLSEAAASDNTNAKKADPDLSRGPAWEPLGFTTPSYVMVVNRTGNVPIAEVLDPLALAGAQLIGRPITLEGLPPTSRCSLVLSPDAHYLAAVRYSAIPTAVAPKVGNYLTINSLNVAARDPLKLGLTNLPENAPVAVTGLCYWQDGSRVSLLYQEGGNGLIETYQSPTAKQLKYRIFTGPAGFPAKDFRGSALTVIADGSAFLINGRYVVDADTIDPLGDLGIEGVEDVHLVDHGTLQMLVKSEGKSKILLVKLDLSKFKAPTSAPAIPHSR